MIPKHTVIIENIHLGPKILTVIVAGSWNVTLATVYTKIETDCSPHEHIAFESLGNVTHITIPNSQPQVFKNARNAGGLFHPSAVLGLEV
jgi:hypothetical protein